MSTELAESPPSGSGRAGVVLVVDDTEANRYSVARWLEHAGFRVALAATGAEALRLARAEVDLVVLDVHLPDVHGFEVARTLKASVATSHVPVLHLSAKYVALADRVSGLEGGADAYLTQPVAPEELTATVGALLRLSRAQRALSERNVELEAAQAEASRKRAIAEQVLDLSIALTTAGAPSEVAEAVCRHAPALFGGVGAVVARRADDGAQVELLAASDMADDVRAGWARFPLNARVPLADVVRTGEAIFLESSEDWTTRYPDVAPLAESGGHRANAVAPLIVDDRIVGAIGIAYAAPRRFTADERALLQSTARHAALALERARLLESERANRAAAEAANRAKSEFLAVMSHELRTPLNAIAGYAELIETGIQGPVTEDQRTSLARIQRSQRHLLGLINSVLNFSRVESGHVRYEVADVRVEEVLRCCEELVEAQAGAKDIRLRIDGCPAGLHVRADAEKVQQIVLNLLSNAVKFTEPGGEVSLGCVVAGGDGGRALIQVRDSGVGIAPDELERVFQPFVQLHPRRSGAREGTGLGLSISRDLARGMGGELTVESEVGTGSTFTLSLPLLPAVSPTASA